MNMQTEHTPIDPMDPKWKITFRLYSWWQSMDGRSFMIFQRWFNYKGHLTFIELVEQNREARITLAYADFFKQFEQGKLQCKSREPDERIVESWPAAQLIPERNY